MADDEEREPFRFLGKEEVLALPPEERARYIQRAIAVLRRGQGHAPEDEEPPKKA